MEKIVSVGKDIKEAQNEYGSKYVWVRTEESGFVGVFLSKIKDAAGWRGVSIAMNFGEECLVPALINAEVEVENVSNDDEGRALYWANKIVINEDVIKEMFNEMVLNRM